MTTNIADKRNKRGDWIKKLCDDAKVRPVSTGCGGSEPAEYTITWPASDPDTWPASDPDVEPEKTTISIIPHDDAWAVVHGKNITVCCSYRQLVVVLQLIEEHIRQW